MSPGSTVNGILEVHGLDECLLNSNLEWLETSLAKSNLGDSKRTVCAIPTFVRSGRAGATVAHHGHSVPSRSQ